MTSYTCTRGLYSFDQRSPVRRRKKTWYMPSPEQLRAYWLERYTMDEIRELAAGLWALDDRESVVPLGLRRAA